MNTNSTPNVLTLDSISVITILTCLKYTLVSSGSSRILYIYIYIYIYRHIASYITQYV